MGVIVCGRYLSTPIAGWRTLWPDAAPAMIVGALGILKASEINWTYFSPAGYSEAGERTGKFRLGTTS